MPFRAYTPFSQRTFQNLSWMMACVNALPGLYSIFTLTKSSPVFMRATEGVFAYNYQNILTKGFFSPFF